VIPCRNAGRVLSEKETRFDGPGQTKEIATLDQHVEDLALVVDGPPEVYPLASDPDNHLVQVPSIARPGTAPA
jgi:hypothetical protein